MRIGITGHQDIRPTTRRLLEAALHERLARETQLEGWSSLAAGADQLFAEEILGHGGRLVAVIPSADYADGFGHEEGRAFSRLLGRAHQVVELPHERASEQAYWEAGQRVVLNSDVLIAIWDGQPSAGLGGTGDVVAFARRQAKPVEVLWPTGAQRG